MTPKVLAQTGVSLADVYHIEGSIVGVDQLDVHTIKGVHDLGPQIQSERLRSFVEVMDTGDILQNVQWGIALGTFPDCVNRIVSISVITDVAARVTHCSLAFQENGVSLEYPLWVWDAAEDAESAVIWDDGAGSATENILRPLSVLPGGLPTIVCRSGDAGGMPDLIFRGLSSGFGAGTVQARAVIQVIRPTARVPTPGEPSSHGLPIPSW